MIEIQAIKKRDEKRQVAYFTQDGIEFSCGDVPIELDTEAKILVHLKKRENEFKLLILINQYLESDYKRFLKEGMTELEAMVAWVAAGHKNKIQVGLTTTGKPKYGYKVIEKQELEYRHPKSIGLVAKIEGASITPEMKDLLKEIIK